MRVASGSIPSVEEVRGWRSGGRAWRLGLLALAALSAGCVAVVPYTPDESQVQSLGVDKAKQELELVLARAIEPQIALVEPKDDSLHYRWNQTHLGAFYQTVTIPNDTLIFYANLSRIELYENSYVYLYAPNDSRVDKVRFASLEDAKRFSDLVMSFRAKWRADQSAPKT
jgi:hypothetical protein